MTLCPHCNASWDAPADDGTCYECRQPMSLKGMTHQIWERLPEDVRERLRTPSLSPQLTGLEGWRVEVVDDYGERRRFIVSRSTGWIPVHLELRMRTSTGGIQASQHYASVRKLYQARTKRGAYWI